MKKSLVSQVKAIGLRASWCLLSLCFFAFPAKAQNLPPTTGHIGRVYWMSTVSDGEPLARALEQVIDRFLPGASDDLRWKIIIEDRTTFLREGDVVAHEYVKGDHMFPPRCHTWMKIRVTECMGPWVREFSQGAKAGTMAHEYGHIKCADDGVESNEACADDRAMRILCPQCWVGLPICEIGCVPKKP